MTVHPCPPGFRIDDPRRAASGGAPVKRVLMVAYHFPPLAGSSGVQRTLRFARHLPSFNWEPYILSAASFAYERTTSDLDAEVPAGLVVRRAFALDAARHLAFRGRYPGFLARPDRWATWELSAVWSGMKMFRQFRPNVLWTTYPIATAHAIGARLHEKTGLPWVADFRDPMAQDGYPEDGRIWSAYKKIEEQVIRSASCSIFATPGAALEYKDRYPAYSEKIRFIENGYDEDSFVAAEQEAISMGPLADGRLTLLHSGIVYPSERDPTQLLEALSRLRQAYGGIASRLRVRFRAAVHDTLLRELARKFQVEEMIEVEPPIGYRPALVEMMRADALLVLQASNCNMQVPAKVYEYLRARRPLLVLSDPAGDTVRVLRAAGLDRFARLDRVDEIASLIAEFLSNPIGRTFMPTDAAIATASRKSRTRELAAVLDQVVVK